MEELSLHILDIVENSIRAGAKRVELNIVEDAAADLLEIEIRDNGAGMDQATLEKVMDPFFTTKSVRRVGLGLPLFGQAARAAGGDLLIQSEPGRGTSVKATFQYSHIDRQPLGDLAKTLETLIVAHPEVRFCYYHRENGEEFRMDSSQLYAEAVDLSNDLVEASKLHGSPAGQFRPV